MKIFSITAGALLALSLHAFAQAPTGAIKLGKDFGGGFDGEEGKAVYIIYFKARCWV